MKQPPHFPDVRTPDGNAAWQKAIDDVGDVIEKQLGECAFLVLALPFHDAEKTKGDLNQLQAMGNVPQKAMHSMIAEAAYHGARIELEESNATVH